MLENKKRLYLIKLPKIVDSKELKIRRGVLERGNDVECFDVTWLPNNTYKPINNCCDYENVIELISKTYPDIIVISPDGLNAVTLVQMLYETDENYYPITRKIQRGGEFVEKYVSYELILVLKPEAKKKEKAPKD